MFLPALVAITISLFVWIDSCLASDTPPIPRTSSLTEAALRDEALYLQEETVVTAIRRE